MLQDLMSGSVGTKVKRIYKEKSSIITSATLNNFKLA